MLKWISKDNDEDFVLPKTQNPTKKESSTQSSPSYAERLNRRTYESDSSDDEGPKLSFEDVFQSIPGSGQSAGKSWELEKLEDGEYDEEVESLANFRKLLLCGGGGTEISAYSAITGKLLTRTKLWGGLYGQRVCSVIKIGDGSVAAGFLDGTIRLFNIWGRSVLQNKVIKGHVGSNHIFGLAFDPNSSLLASGSQDGTCKIHKIDNDEKTAPSKCLHEITHARRRSDEAEAILSVQFLHPNSQFASSDAKGKILIHSHDSQLSLIRKISHHKDGVFSLQYDSSTSTLLAASWDCSATISDLRTKKSKCFRIKTTHAEGFQAALSVSNWHQVYLGASSNTDDDSTNGRIWVYDIRKPKGAQCTVRAHGRCVYRIVSLEDEGAVASCSIDQSVKIWKKT